MAVVDKWEMGKRKGTRRREKRKGTRRRGGGSGKVGGRREGEKRGRFCRNLLSHGQKVFLPSALLQAGSDVV